MRLLLLFVTIGFCAACSRGSAASSPSTPTSSYAGEWAGLTSQNAPITVTVSSDQKVTSITVGYNFGGCSGSKTFSNLSLAIGTTQRPPDNPLPPSAVDNPGFGFGSGDPAAPNYTQVFGTFTSSQTLTGSVAFGSYTDCGNTVAIWSATKR